MNNQQDELIVSGIHLELTPSIKTHIREKVKRLFRHEEQIVRVRFEVEFDRTSLGKEFVAKGHISIYGPDMNASVSSDDLYKSIDLLVDKLDRMIRRRARLRKVKRNHPHPVEIPAELPKV